MRRIHLLAWGMAFMAVLGISTATVMAHITVLKTMPPNESNVSGPPERLQVWFNQQPSPRISRLELRGPAGEDVELGKVEVHRADRSISAPVPAALPPGKYEAAWRTAGDDGHVMRGTFTFTVAPAK
jgi:methionine-rich copper-binding protein CopC